jgi:hypothetical protein
MRHLAGSALILLLFSGSAAAECRSAPFGWHYKGETVRVPVSGSAGDTCLLFWGTSGKLASARLVSPPSGGKATVEMTNVRYTPRAKAPVSDTFAVELCGSAWSVGRGCSILEFNLSLR